MVYSGSEAASLAALDKAYEGAGADPDVLLEPALGPGEVRPRRRWSCPRTTTSARKALENEDADGYACDYADDVLYKAFSEQLQQDDPAAFEFLSNMTWTAEDQNAVALDIEEGIVAGGGWEEVDGRESGRLAGLAAGGVTRV